MGRCRVVVYRRRSARVFYGRGVDKVFVSTRARVSAVTSPSAHLDGLRARGARLETCVRSWRAILSAAPVDGRARARAAQSMPRRAPKKLERARVPGDVEALPERRASYASSACLPVTPAASLMTSRAHALPFTGAADFAPRLPARREEGEEERRERAKAASICARRGRRTRGARQRRDFRWRARERRERGGKSICNKTDGRDRRGRDRRIRGEGARAASAFALGFGRDDARRGSSARGRGAARGSRGGGADARGGRGRWRRRPGAVAPSDGFRAFLSRAPRERRRAGRVGSGRRASAGARTGGEGAGRGEGRGRTLKNDDSGVRPALVLE